MKINNPSLTQYIDGVINGEKVIVATKLYKDNKNLYHQIDQSLSDDTIMYEVYSVNCDEYLGNLNWGLTVLYPVKVCNEFNLTRGHYHEDIKCNEFYYCIQGEGLLLLMDENNNTWAEKMMPGSLHQINGNLAHRLINTGNISMKVIASWSTKAGHDYQRVEKQPFRYRIFDGKDNFTIIEND